MNTYKMVIEADLNKVALRDYTVVYVDIEANNHLEAVQSLQEKYGNNFVVSLVSKM